MTKNDLALLDCDEYRREDVEARKDVQAALAVCRKHNAVLDFATSDVCIFVINSPSLEATREIAAAGGWGEPYDKETIG